MGEKITVMVPQRINFFGQLACEVGLHRPRAESEATDAIFCARCAQPMVGRWRWLGTTHRMDWSFFEFEREVSP